MSLSLYLHWPFCESKCPYCDFNSHVRDRIDEASFEQAYIQELKRHQELLGRKKLISIFFGGGTPSLMSPKTVESILTTVYALFDIEKGCEITLEANPSSFEVEKFKDFKKLGINRLSLGVQSFNDDDLRYLGRRHNATQARTALKEALSIFDNVSFDLIYARRPSQTLSDWEKELKTALSYEVKHLSLYQLTLEPGTVFFKKAQNGELDLPDEDTSLELYLTTVNRLEEKGYRAYEVSNFAKPGFESVHNKGYWSYNDYIGIGPGAHGRLTIEDKKIATTHYKLPEKWAQEVLNHKNGAQEAIFLDQKDQLKERLLMGLRVLDGLAFHGVFFDVIDEKKLNRLIESKDLVLENNILKTTLQGRLRLEAILRYLVKETV
ncbi:MAG TPA: radical SAM family heme chaperone HemW [Alphaproteobacteria bacterium]|nr:radical SAM family heme chaperone HemW [Alphaproteobacteria bacterium]